MAKIIGNDAHTMLAAAVSTRNIVLITDTLMCIGELVEEIQKRFQVSLKPGMGRCMTFSNPQNSAGLDFNAKNVQSSSAELFGASIKGESLPDNQMVRHTSSSASTSSSQPGIQCSLCEETVPDRTALNKHLESHCNQEPSGFKCGYCKEGFQELSELQSHIASGTCGVSNLAFATPQAPAGNADMDTDMSLMNSTSEFAGNISANNSQQNADNQTKYLSCPLCFKVFSRSYQLNLHLARHQTATLNPSGRTYSCRTCSRTFNFTSNRAKHEKICRRGLAKRAQTHLYPGAEVNNIGTEPIIRRQQYECRKCNDSFLSPIVRARHEETCEVITLPSFNKSMTPNAGKSPHVGNKVSGNSLELPISVNNFKQVVSSAIPSKIKDETGKITSMFCCAICSKLLQTRHSLESHYMSHLGIKPHACKWCGRRFTDSSNWRKHQKNCNEQRHDLMSDLPTMVPPNYSSLNSLSLTSTPIDNNDKSFEKRPPSTSSSMSNMSMNLGSTIPSMKAEPIDISSDNEATKKPESTIESVPVKSGSEPDVTESEPPVVVDSGLSWFVGDQ